MHPQSRSALGRGVLLSSTEDEPMANEALVAQLLHWIGPEPRNYVETLEAWRTSCPRLTVWEDAVTAGLIERVPGASLKDAQVRVTPEGKAYLRLREAVPA
jgi:hypothetical protein